MAPERLAVKASIDRDPDGAKLSSILCAHLSLERARSRRSVWVHLMAALSVPESFVALQPGWLSPAARRVVLLSWALSAVTAAAAALVEWRWRWRRDSQAAEIRENLPSGQ